MGESSGDKLLAVLAHASFFFLPIVLPLVLMLAGTDGFVKHHARQALVAHLFFAVAGFVSALLVVVFIGIVLGVVVGIFSLIVTIIAIVRSLDGEYYRYPISGNWFN